MIIKMWKCLDLMGWWHFHDLLDFERRIFNVLFVTVWFLSSQKKGQKVDRLQNEIKFANFYNLLPQLMQLKTKKNFDTTVFEDEVVFYQQKTVFMDQYSYHYIPYCILKLACYTILIKMAFNMLTFKVHLIISSFEIDFLYHHIMLGKTFHNTKLFQVCARIISIQN